MKKEEFGRKVCPVCGNPFYILVEEKEWAYHVGRNKYDDVVCSWHCAVESEKASSRRAKRSIAERKPYERKVERENLDVNLVMLLDKIGMTQKQAAKEMGVSESSVNRWVTNPSIATGANREKLLAFIKRHGGDC